jgi:N-acetylmuramoyl-L-alanine amidase
VEEGYVRRRRRVVSLKRRRRRMTYRSIVISSGHGKYIRGASDILDEVDEARRVVDRVAVMLRERGVSVDVFHDNTSHDQSTNLSTIVNYHNSRTREVDISVHFNAYEHTSKPMGTETLYVSSSGEAIARQMSPAIASCGFTDRGPKYRGDLYFLNNTEMPAILIEVCFVDSSADANIYDESFERICDKIADVIGGEGGVDQPPIDQPPVDTALLHVTGPCSWFGGPEDSGVSPSEGLAFISSTGQQPELFLPYQPEGTTGLARRLNPQVPYVACRWDYDVTPKPSLLLHKALIKNPRNGKTIYAFPADWGPNENTGRVADLSPCVMSNLELGTDDVVEVIYPIDPEMA